MPWHLEVGTAQCQTDLLSRLMAFVCHTDSHRSARVCQPGEAGQLTPALPALMLPSSFAHPAEGPGGLSLGVRMNRAEILLQRKVPRGDQITFLQAFSGWKW